MMPDRPDGKETDRTEAEGSRQLTASADPSELDARYLKDEASFWRNVQEPSTRVRDPVLLAALAKRSLIRFDDRYIRAAAVVNLHYRATEPSWTGAVSVEELASQAREVFSLLKPTASFSDCRWFLSGCLAICALHLYRDERESACIVLEEPHRLLTYAHSQGQLFTNVAKAALLRLAVAHTLAQDAPQRRDLGQVADDVLEHSRDLASYYKFTNEFAYEEVAYVYSMLREIYNWRRLHKGQADSLRDLERAGFRWRRVGGPFNTLLKT